MTLPRFNPNRVAIVAFAIAAPLVALEVVWLWPLIAFLRAIVWR